MERKVPIHISFFFNFLLRRNRLLKAGVAVSTQNTPRRKIAILQTDTGGNQFETAHLPFRRPKNISLLDQLNRIDMIGFNRFLDMIGGKNPEQSPPKQRPGWPNAPHSQSPRSPRRPSVSNPKRPSISAPNQSSQRHSPLGFAPDDESIQKPPSSIAGTCKITFLLSIITMVDGSSGAASSYHPVKEHSAHIQQNSLQKNSASSKNNHVQRSPEKPKSAQQTQPIHRIIEPKPPSAPSKFGKRNHRKSVLVPSHGLETPILTDDDTALLVKVDRRDSNHKVNLPNQPPGQRWGTQTNTTEVTSRADEDEEDKEKDSDLLSDFGSLHYQGGKAATYSNNVDALTTNWDSLQLYKFNSDFNANEIQDVSILLLF